MAVGLDNAALGLHIQAVVEGGLCTDYLSSFVTVAGYIYPDSWGV